MEDFNAKQVFESYHSAASNFFYQMAEDTDFYNGNQWSPGEVRSLKAARQFPVVVNVIAPAVEQGVALLTDRKPRFSATAKETSDIKLAQIYADLMSYIWNISNGNQELKTAVKDYYIKGLGYLLAYIDPLEGRGQGEIKIKSIDPTEVLVDPHSKRKDFSDSRHIIITQVFTKEEIEFMYPQFKFSTDVEREMGSELSEYGINYDSIKKNNYSLDGAERYRIVEFYSKIRSANYQVRDTVLDVNYEYTERDLMEFLSKPAFLLATHDSNNYVTDFQKIEEVGALYSQVGEYYHYIINQETGEPTIAAGEENVEDGSMPGSTTKIIPTTMEELVKNEIILLRPVPVVKIRRRVYIGWKPFFDTILDIEHFPIIPLVGNHHRSPYPTSDVRKAKDLQRMINKIRSLIIAHASSTTNVKLLLPKGAVDKKEVEKEWAKAGTGVITYDATIGVPSPVLLNSLPNELYKNEADAKRDIEFLFGIFAMMHGDAAQAPPTYKGTIALEEMGVRRLKTKKDDIEDALNVLGKVVSQFIQQVYTYEKIIRITNPNNVSQETIVNSPLYDETKRYIIGKNNDISTIHADITVVSGSTLPSDRWARLDAYLALYSNGIIDQIEVLKQTEVADMDGVLERSSYIRQLESQIQQMNEANGALQGQIQTMQRENIHLNKRVEVAKFAADLKSQSNAAEHASILFRERQQDEAGMQKRQMDQLNQLRGNDGSRDQ